MMAITKGEDIVIMTKDDARKLLGWLRSEDFRMTKEVARQLARAGVLGLIDELARAVREPEDPIDPPIIPKRITPDIVPLDDGGLAQKAQKPPKEDV